MNRRDNLYQWFHRTLKSSLLEKVKFMTRLLIVTLSVILYQVLNPYIFAASVLKSIDTIRNDSTRFRVIISTDFPPLDVIPGDDCTGPANKCSDPDDIQSMVRFLLYTNEFDVEALIASAGTFANIARKQNILDILDLYDQVDENLREHDNRYPIADKLRSVTFQGRDNTWGKSISANIGAGKDSEASDSIIAIVDRPDTRPVWICIWGDCSNVAQAIWRVQNTRTDAELQSFIGKLRIYQIAHQDDTIDWLLNNFPELFIIYSKTTYLGIFGGPGVPLADLAWINENIRNDHGPLGAVYPPSGYDADKPGMQEGDTPSFLHLVSAVHGLNDAEDPTQPSWGGQFKRDGSTNHWVDGPGGSSISRWKTQYQSEFAQRADWMLQTTSVEDTRSGQIHPYFELEQNYPNPFNPITQIKYSITSGSYVTLKIYNLFGQEVTSLLEGFKEPGNYSVTFNGSGLPSGFYLYQLKAERFCDIKKAVLLK